MSVIRHTDTIVAPITAVGGAVGVVRVSGPVAWSVGAAVFQGWPDPVIGRQAVYGRFVYGDDGLVLPFPAGSSYTGEETVEMSVHGSRASVSALVSACVSAGARMAEPGEFTLRAFMNGRIDLTQAEGVRDSVLASTDAQMRQANMLREGALRDQIKGIRERVLSVLAKVEASTDFSEEIGELDRIGAQTECLLIRTEIDKLLATARASHVVRGGLTVAIAGLPNAGKSSLLNALVKSDRAIVTDIPGTTRDTIEEVVSVDGLLVRLIDTAGLRETDDVVEALGVERSRSAIENADFVLYVYDASVGWQQVDAAYVESVSNSVIEVANKSDLECDSERGVAVSCVTGEGLTELLDLLANLTANSSREAGLLNSRHELSLREAKEAMTRAWETFCADVPDDLGVVDLMAAARALGEITGETATPDVIERVFHDFCIGK